MSQRPSLHHLNQLSDYLHDLMKSDEASLSFFTGAGISVPAPSCLPQANEVIRQVIRAIGQSTSLDDLIEPLIEQLLSSGIRMEEVFHTIQQQIGDRLEGVLPIFNAEYANFYHYFLARCIEKGQTKNIITTNFDQLIEQAAQTELKVWATEEEHAERHPLSLYKIHGTVDRSETLIAMLPQIVRGLGESKQKLLADTFATPCLVIGWSDNDIDLTPSFFQAANGMLIWFHYAPGKTEIIDFRENPEASGIKGVHEKIIQILKQTGGVLVATDPADFLHRLWQRLESQLGPIPAIDPEGQPNWQPIIDHWQSGLQIGERHLIIAELLSQLNNWKQAIEVLQAVEPINNLPAEHRHRLHYRMGIYASRTLQWQQAIHYYEKSLADKGYPMTLAELIEKRPEDFEIAHLYGNIGQMLQDMGQLPAAAVCLQMDFELSRKSNRSVVLSAASNYTSVLMRLGEIQTAKTIADIGIDLALKRGDLASFASLKQATADMAVMRGNIPEAIQEMKALLEPYQMLGQPRPLIYTYNEIARLNIRIANFTEAKTYAEKALETSIANTSYEHQVNSLMTLGILFKEMGVMLNMQQDQQSTTAFQNGILQYQKAKSIMASHPVKDRLQSQLLNNCGLLYMIIGQYTEAEIDLKKSLEIRSRVGDERGKATVLGNLSLVLLRKSPPEFTTAESYLLEALHIYDHFKDGPGRCQILNELGGAYLTKLRLMVRAKQPEAELLPVLIKAKGYFKKSLELAIEYRLPAQIQQAKQNLTMLGG